MRRIAPRRILPERVFGSRSTMSAVRKLAIGPIRWRTSPTAPLPRPRPPAVDPGLQHQQPERHLPLQRIGAQGALPEGGPRWSEAAGG
jgi:hypothetical protein